MDNQNVDDNKKDFGERNDKLAKGNIFNLFKKKKKEEMDVSKKKEKKECLNQLVQILLNDENDSCDKYIHCEENDEENDEENSKENDIKEKGTKEKGTKEKNKKNQANNLDTSHIAPRTLYLEESKVDGELFYNVSQKEKKNKDAEFSDSKETGKKKEKKKNKKEKKEKTKKRNKEKETKDETIGTMDQKFKEILKLAKTNVDNDCCHLKKIQSIVKDISENLKHQTVFDRDLLISSSISELENKARTSVWTYDLEKCINMLNGISVNDKPIAPSSNTSIDLNELVDLNNNEHGKNIKENDKKNAEKKKKEKKGENIGNMIGKNIPENEENKHDGLNIKDSSIISDSGITNIGDLSYSYDVRKNKETTFPLNNKRGQLDTLNRECEKNSFKLLQHTGKIIQDVLSCNVDFSDINEIIDILNLITCPYFENRIDKNEYLELFIKKCYYIYPYEDLDSLKKIRKYIQTKYLQQENIQIDAENVADMYIKTDLKQILHNDKLINNIIDAKIDNGKFWIQLLHNIWIPLVIEHFNSFQITFYSYLMNYNNDVALLDQFCYSRVSIPFYRFSNFVFTGILFCGVPAVYRLLFRLCTYRYAEARINVILQDKSNNIYDSIVASSLNYNIEILRNMFPFFKEFKNLDIELIVSTYFESPFFTLVLNSLKEENIKSSNNLNQNFFNFINSFLLMSTEFLYGASTACKNILTKINASQIQLWEILEKAFYENMNLLIARDLLLFLIDVLCLYKINNMCIKKGHCQKICTYTGIVKNIYYKTIDNICNHNTGKQVYVIAVKLEQFVTASIEKTQTVDINLMIQELSLVNRLYCNNVNEENSIGEFYTAKNANYGIYCWNSICSKRVDIHCLDKNQYNFEYCPGCSIATYCSEECKITHLLSSHHNVCSYFKSVPSFLKYNTLNDDFYRCEVEYLNIFSSIDMYDLNNDRFFLIY